MKSTVSLILSFLLCNLCFAQHISEFTSLKGLGQDSNFNLPSTHSFQVLFSTQDFLDMGGFIPNNNLKGPNFDFAGYVPIEGNSKNGYLSINSEMAPGAVTILDIEFDDVLGSWSWDKNNSDLVDFSLLSDLVILPLEPLFPTAANCSGTVTPWNTIITCEEYTSIELLQRNTEEGYEWVQSTDLDDDGYHDLGWAIEIDPATKTIINQPGGRDDKDKLWAMGNFKHENAVIRADHKTVYQGADATNGDGYLFKFVASNAQDLSQGDLFVYKGDKVNIHEWLKLANSTQEEQNSTIAQCKTLEATAFGGIEDVEINPKDSLIYFAVKRESHTELGFENKGVVYRFKDSENGIEDFEMYAGGNSVYEIDLGNNNYEDVVWGDGTDNLVFDDLGNLWVAQDGDDNYIWVVENGHTQESPKVKIFARTPKNSEPTGLTFSPDQKYIFMSIQHPSDNSSDQTDVFGTPVSFNNDVVLVISRKENLDFREKDPRDDIMITQYYHDIDSKWIEVKNISGEYIYDSSYFLNLYDSELLNGDPPSTVKAIQAIPAMEIGEVLLFKNEGAVMPLAEHLGGSEPIVSEVCDFDGDDVILITSTSGNLKYNNRRDILGTISTATYWGQNTSLIRGANSSEIPERDFEVNNWIELDPILEVNQADKLKNIALGTHVIGSAVWDGISWNNNSPADRTRNTEINGDYMGGQEDFAAYDLKINETGSLNFEVNEDGSNKNVIVYRNLTIDANVLFPNGSLIIGDTESLIIKNEAAIVTGDIEKIEKSSVRNHPSDITYWSSPVQDEQIENVFKNVDLERVFLFDQTKHTINDLDDDTYWDVWVNATGLMVVGMGYASEGFEGTTGVHEVHFTGKPNFGNIQTNTMDFNDDTSLDNDWNLIGNPYPAAINIEAFLDLNASDNKVIDGTVYFWTHATAAENGKFSGSDYVTYNFVGGVSGVENLEVDENIGSGQGFFVRALKAEKISFDPTMILEGSNDQFFKGTQKKRSVEKNRLWLNLKGSDNSFKQILIGFDDKATDHMDSGYDALYLKGNQPIAFYSVLDDRKLAIQGLGPFNDQKLINLGFDTELEGLEMEMELSRKEGLLKDQEILLLDNANGIIHDLNLSPYNFTYEGIGSFQDRFSLLFNSAVLGLDEDAIAQDVKVYMKDQNLIIDAQNIIEQIKVYDALGRLVHKEQTQSDYFELNLDRIKMGGFFIIELIDNEGKTKTRKMVKY